MVQKNEKPKPKPDPAATQFVKTKRLLGGAAVRVASVEFAVAKVRGILSGASSADTLDNLRHRIRSALGHRKALAAAVGTLNEVLKTLHDTNFELG